MEAKNEEENPGTYNKIIKLLDDKNIDFKLIRHKPIITSE